MTTGTRGGDWSPANVMKSECVASGVTMGRIALLTLTVFAVIGSWPTNAADLVTQSDVVAVMTAVPGEGAAHHALVKRQADESLNDLFGRAYSECGDARCRVVGVWQRGDCVALAQGKKYVYWAWRSELEDAEKRALASCNASAESCSLLTSECFAK
jgi:hypothetical protein